MPKEASTTFRTDRPSNPSRLRPFPTGDTPPRIAWRRSCPSTPTRTTRTEAGQVGAIIAVPAPGASGECA